MSERIKTDQGSIVINGTDGGDSVQVRVYDENGLLASHRLNELQAIEFMRVFEREYRSVWRSADDEPARAPTPEEQDAKNKRMSRALHALPDPPSLAKKLGYEETQPGAGLSIDAIAGEYARQRAAGPCDDCAGMGCGTCRNLDGSPKR